MKLHLVITVDADVPDRDVTGGATPETIAAAAREALQARVSRMFAGWVHSVTVEATTSPDPKGGA